MTMTDQDAPVVGMARAMTNCWCVYEHWIVTEPGSPPELIYIGACPIGDVFDMRQAKNNSEWARIFATDRQIIVRIVATATDQREAMSASISRVKSLPVMPRCNLRGFNLFAQSRRIVCSNGEEYENQTVAARKLNINQGAISRHLKGELAAVKGYTFTYKGADI